MGTSDAPWRVYLSEWVTVWTSDAIGPEGKVECIQHFQGKYQGRVRDEDWRVVREIYYGEELTRPPYCVQLYVPNLWGEFKDRETAADLAYDQAGSDPILAQRGSEQEQALLDYGKKMLPATG